MTVPRVLVIDDDADMRTLMNALLEHLGADVVTVADASGLSSVLATTFDLILLDLVMPGRQHDECVSVLVGAGATAPVCLLSGSDTRTLADARARLDAQGLRTTTPLTKPARLDALAALLASLAAT